MATPTRGRPSEFDRDHAVLTAARLFWRYGFAGTSTRALTTATGLSTSSLYAAFGSKAGLFHEAVSTFTAEYREIYSRAVALESLNRVIEVILTESVYEFTAPSESSPGCFVSSAVMSDSADSIDTVAYIADLHRSNEETLLTRVEHAATQGELPADANVHAVVGAVQAMWHGLSVQSRSGVPRQVLLSNAQFAATAIVEYAKNGVQHGS